MHATHVITSSLRSAEGGLPVMVMPMTMCVTAGITLITPAVCQDVKTD